MTRAWKSYFFKVLGPEKISQAQMSLLFYLGSSGPASGRSIGAALQLSPSAAAQQLDGLAHLGYITREVSTTDRRITYFGLSDTGQEKLKILEEKSKELFRNFTETLTDEEMDAMIRTQQKIVDQVRKYQSQHTGETA
jgi:DNA-binding MarR family transcriptional regulator